MARTACRYGWKGILCVVLALGCSKTVKSPPVDQDAAVREQFAELQSALKNRDTDKLWTLLDDKSKAQAERAAKDIQTAHDKATPEDKAKHENALGLTTTEFARLTGKGYLKTKRFQKKYDELPESKIDRVVVQGDSATVYYLEPDGDKEKAILVRQDGRWKVWLTMPKAGAGGNDTAP
jgi:hypothetical protein